MNRALHGLLIVVVSSLTFPLVWVMDRGAFVLQSCVMIRWSSCRIGVMIRVIARVHVMPIVGLCHRWSFGYYITLHDGYDSGRRVHRMLWYWSSVPVDLVLWSRAFLMGVNYIVGDWDHSWVVNGMMCCACAYSNINHSLLAVQNSIWSYDTFNCLFIHYQIYM